MDGRQLRKGLVRSLRRKGVIRSKQVEDAFLAVPREVFVPDVAKSEGLHAVYSDEVIAVKRDERGIPISSSSQPAIMAEMLEHLDLRHGSRVLEIGTGTGYNAALLKSIVGDGLVVSVDVEPDLAEAAKRRLDALGYEVVVITGDGSVGWADNAPYDRIIATASVPAVPHAWFDQIRTGGILVVPYRPGGRAQLQVVVAFERTPDAFSSRALIPGGFMNLRPLGEQAGSVAGPALPSSDEQPIVVELDPPPPRYVFDILLALSCDPGLLVELGGGASGVVKEGTLAFAAGRGGTVSRVESHGGPHAGEEILRVYRRWLDLGSPALDALRIEISRAGEVFISSSNAQPGS